MVTIELNGYIVTGETLKEAQRLARKEEKRLKEEDNRRQDYLTMAYDMAFASLGRITLLLAKHPQAINIHGTEGYVGESEDGIGSVLFATSPGQESGRIKLYSTDTVHKLITNSAGYTYAYLKSEDDKSPVWYAVGTSGGQVASVEIPVSISSQLYGLMSQRTKQAA